MLQQTQVVTVIPYYRRFLERFPTVADLAKAPEQDVLKLWEGLGYYSRARNLHRAAQMVMELYNGVIPSSEEVFGKLPGVGPYIRAAVLSIAGNTPLPTVDGNVLRVYTRYRGIAEDIRKTALRKRVFNELREIIPREAPGDFNQGMMELGALVCTPRNPDCRACPLKIDCTAFTTGTVEKYPFKSASGKVPEYKVSVGIIVKNDRFYIQKRPSEGHLGGLWEFPGGKSEPGETPEQTLVRECREELGVGVRVIEKLAVVRHAYSHFKISMTVFICQIGLESNEEITAVKGRPFRWITIEELMAYPFPGANHKFFPKLKDYYKKKGA